MGELPVLQYCALEQLNIDDSYQRSLEAAASITLIRRIATFWDWGLCQPLYVARRADGALYVVDGQHRLAAARLRGDVWQLPCVVRTFASAGEEAAAFVALNQERRPLNKLQMFKAAIAAGNMEAAQIVVALQDAGLSLASSTNLETCPPGAVSFVAGLQLCYRTHGLHVLTTALDVLAQAYKGRQLRYGGTMFPGIVAIVAAEIEADGAFADGWKFGLMTEMVGGAEQTDRLKDILAAQSAEPTLNRRTVCANVFKVAWADCMDAGDEAEAA